MSYEILYSEDTVKKDIPKITSDLKPLIQKAIQTKLSVQPLLFGLPLRTPLKNYRKLRVGNYRVIYRVETEVVKIFAIQHRSVVYKTANKRLL